MARGGAGVRDRARRIAPAPHALEIRDLHVYYGLSHALQGVNLTLPSGVHAVVGRNGMGKTTLCNAVMGLLPVQRGSIRLAGEELVGLPPYRVANRGVGYTPQGRRLWPSLTVDEHLRLAWTGGGAWTVERVYDTFPRLAERRNNGGGQLSGGEQQMLAIARALLQDPELLVLDEPTEGLAPIIVDQVEELLSALVEENQVAILLIEQNISVATAIAERVSIMVNGRIPRTMPSGELAADRLLQERLLGVGRHSLEDLDLDDPAADAASEETLPVEDAPPDGSAEHASASQERAESSGTGTLAYVPPTRWSGAVWQERPDAATGRGERPFDAKPEPLFREPAASFDPRSGGSVYLAGTFDTKGAELGFIRDRLIALGVAVKTVDLSTSGATSSADAPPHVVAASHPRGSSEVFTGERGRSVAAMAEAFESWLVRQPDVAGVIAAGGSGGTALATPAMQALPVGVPKVMISTVASGDVGRYVGAADIMMMYSVTDVQGLNRISRTVLANGASAMAGMLAGRRKPEPDEAGRPCLGLTMFGVTTPAVQQVTALLEDRYDCLVFHATGTGGRSMEKLADSGLLAAAIDLTTTEVCDMQMGGVFPATEDRFGAFIRTRLPCVVSLGALDMANFGPRDTVPERYRERLFVEHNPQVTLMRTTPGENARMGSWIGERLNRMTGPVRLLIPEGGVSALDAPGQPFHAPDADAALFDALAGTVQETPTRRLVRLPHHINDPAFARAAADALDEISPLPRTARHAAV